MTSINKMIRVIVAGTFISTVLLSCKKDFLNLDPYDSVAQETAISNESDMSAALNGAYGALTKSTMYGRTIPLFADLVADNVYISTVNSNRYLDFFQVNYTVTNGNAGGIWKGAYVAILRANNVINSPLTGTATIDNYKGQAYAIRALMYFELAKHFCKPYTIDANAMGVPVILEYNTSVKPPRSTLAEVYAQIESDLMQAINLLGDAPSSGFFSEYAAKALLARMYQFKGEWQKALTTAEDVINNGGYSLLQANEVVAYWSQNTPRTDKLETLFEVIFDAVANEGNSSLPYFFDQGGYGDALCADSFYGLFAATDVRKNLFLTTSPTRGAVIVVNKYPNSASPDKDEFKVLRLSEVYLIAAEAAHATNNDVLARTYVNAVATRRDPSFAGYASSGAALLDDILLERRKELAFEGHRYWDLARYNRDVVRVNAGNNYPGNVPLMIATSNFRRIMPIPQAELDANPNIRDQQNDGY